MSEFFFNVILNIHKDYAFTSATGKQIFKIFKTLFVKFSLMLQSLTVDGGGWRESGDGINWGAPKLMQFNGTKAKINFKSDSNHLLNRLFRSKFVVEF